MTDSINEIRIADIPSELFESPEFFESTARRIVNYLIGIVKTIDNENQKDAVLIGSGTLVDIDGILGILTAQHVIDAFPSQGDLGFILSEKLHRPEVDVQTLIYLSIAKSEAPSVGPDLGFIKLPTSVIGFLKAHKSFYNISKNRERLLQEPPPDDVGLWCLCGIPDEKTISEGPIGSFEVVKNFSQFCAFGDILNCGVQAGFDYFQFDVFYDDMTQFPTDFGGVSGGGLWQILLAKDRRGQFILKESILSGVAFYQSSLVDNRRTIKCHGRRSIFDKGHAEVKKEFA